MHPNNSQRLPSRLLHHPDHRHWSADASVCSGKYFRDLDGGVSICLPVESNFQSGVELIDALSIYYTCHGLQDLDCDLARGYLFEKINCVSCGRAATLSAPLEGVCKGADTVPSCIAAGAVDGENDVAVLDEVDAGRELGKFAPLAAANPDSLPPFGLQRILKERDSVQATYDVRAPPTELRPVIPTASGSHPCARWGAAAATVAAALAVVYVAPL